MREVCMHKHHRSHNVIIPPLLALGWMTQIGSALSETCGQGKHVRKKTSPITLLTANLPM